VTRSDKSRSAIYQGLSRIIDEEAVQDMLTQFPSASADKPASEEFVRAEISGLRTEMTTEISRIRTQMTTEISGLRTEMASMKVDIIKWNLATILVVAGLMMAMIRL